MLADDPEMPRWVAKSALAAPIETVIYWDDHGCTSIDHGVADSIGILDSDRQQQG